jgi:DNA-binding response OmpR family regulator
MKKLLLLEDDPAILVGLVHALQQEGFEVTTAITGLEGYQHYQRGQYSVILLDLMLPEMNGFEVLNRIRKTDTQTPVIIISAKGKEEDIVSGFKMGADDYLTKPFGVQELIVRIEALLNRLNQNPKLNPNFKQISINNIEFNFETYQAIHDGQLLDFSQKEIELLKYLVQNQSKVVSRQMVLKNIWRYDEEIIPITRTIDNFIVRLRQKIEKDPKNPRHILTVHKKGYRFEP